MRYAAGIDLGTSFASAAVTWPDAAGCRVVPLGPNAIAPSVVYQTVEGALLTGQAALLAADDPARLAGNFKRRLGDPTPFILGGSPHSAAALMAAQLHDVLARTARFAGGPPASLVLTYPAIWGPYRQEHFTEVLRLAGVTNYLLITEPEAAATHYCTERRLGDGEVVAVYDLGGGTFDTTILRMQGDGMEILGTPDGIEHMGGIDFDEALIAHVDERLGGAVTNLDPAEPGNADALAKIRAICIRAKEDLSLEPDVRLELPLPSGSQEITVSRLEFNKLIQPMVQLTSDTLRRTVASAGLHVDDLTAVLLAGGSSRVPLVSQLLAREFGKPVRSTLHPKFTVALGAAAIRPAASDTAAAPSRRANSSSPPKTASFNRRGRTLPGTGVRKWQLPAIAAASAVVLAATATMFLLDGDDGGVNAGSMSTGPYPPVDNADTAPSTASGTSDTLPVYTNGAASQYTGFVGPATNATGAALGPNGYQSKPITVTPGPDGLRVRWDGTVASRIVMETPSPQDLSSYVDGKGALEFDAVVNKAPRKLVYLSMFCGSPQDAVTCRAVLRADHQFARMKAGRRTTIKVPLSCFTNAGLDARRTYAPFVLFSDGEFDVTFDNVRWRKGAGKDHDAIPCSRLTN